jgi:hypothetical protein
MKYEQWKTATSNELSDSKIASNMGFLNCCQNTAAAKVLNPPPPIIINALA